MSDEVSYLEEINSFLETMQMFWTQSLENKPEPFIKWLNMRIALEVSSTLVHNRRLSFVVKKYQISGYCIQHRHKKNTPT